MAIVSFCFCITRNFHCKYSISAYISSTSSASGAFITSISCIVIVTGASLLFSSVPLKFRNFLFPCNLFPLAPKNNECPANTFGNAISWLPHESLDISNPAVPSCGTGCHDIAVVSPVKLIKLEAALPLLVLTGITALC